MSIEIRNIFSIYKGGDKMQIYERVKNACYESNISVHALEKKLGFPRSSICKWNKNIPSVSKLNAVAKELEKSIEFFLEDDNTEGVQ